MTLTPEQVRQCERFKKACDGIGKWLSATLEDDSVCAEMKADIREWFDALPALIAKVNEQWKMISEAQPYRKTVEAQLAAANERITALEKRIADKADEKWWGSGIA